MCQSTATRDESRERTESEPPETTFGFYGALLSSGISRRRVLDGVDGRGSGKCRRGDENGGEDDGKLHVGGV